jgi:hypothetical protein
MTTQKSQAALMQQHCNQLTGFLFSIENNLKHIEYYKAQLWLQFGWLLPMYVCF